MSEERRVKSEESKLHSGPLFISHTENTESAEILFYFKVPQNCGRRPEGESQIKEITEIILFTTDYSD